MRRSAIRLASAAVVPVILLAGCGKDDDKSSKSASPSSSSVAASPTSSKAPTPVSVPESKVSSINDVTVDTKNAKAPKITLKKKPFQVNKTTTKVLTPGTGATVGAKDTVLVDYTVVNGKDGKSLVNSFNQTQVKVPMADPQQFRGLVTALKGVKVGTSEIVAIPPKDGFGAQGSSQLGVSNADTLVFYMTVRSVLPKQASGTPQQPKAGFPTVSVPKDNTAPATITIPKGAKAPTKTTSETLIEGTGPKVQKGQTVTVHYTGALWNGGTVFDASAKSGQPASFPIGVGQVIKAWDSQVVGKTVGSRIVIVSTAADGYGAQGSPQGGIPANAPLVFVVDILRAE